MEIKARKQHMYQNTDCSQKSRRFVDSQDRSITLGQWNHESRRRMQLGQNSICSGTYTRRPLYSIKVHIVSVPLPHGRIHGKQSVRRNSHFQSSLVRIQRSSKPNTNAHTRNHKPTTVLAILYEINFRYYIQNFGHHGKHGRSYFRIADA
jgi:hypothetical protein